MRQRYNNSVEKILSILKRAIDTLNNKFRFFCACISVVAALLSSCAMPQKEAPLPSDVDMSRINPTLSPLDAPVTDVSVDTVETEPPPAVLYDPVVLMYHLILEEPYNSNTTLFVRPEDFASHLDALSENGYRYLFAEEYQQLGEKSVVVTLDDGYEDNYTEMFPILKEKKAKATVFLITDLINTSGYLTTEQIKEMSQSGIVSFQSHTKSHPSLSSLDEERLHKEFRTSNEIIEGITGKKVTAIAYPAGKHNDLVCSVASQYYSVAFTTKSPLVVAPDNMLRIPRYGIGRGLGARGLINRIGG